MEAGIILTIVGLGGAAACLGAYAWGFIFKPAALRSLHVLSLFATVVSLSQLTFVMRDGSPPGGSLNGVFAMLFLLLAGIAQSLTALQARRTHKGPNVNRAQPSGV